MLIVRRLNRQKKVKTIKETHKARQCAANSNGTAGFANWTRRLLPRATRTASTSRARKPSGDGIPVPEEESRPASANEDEHYAPEIQQRRHEQAPQEQRSGAMSEAFESARELIPGKNKVE